jgi:uncharacterized protein YabN with tetrapyrrole methylase and pyrophosphatase domain
LQWLRSQNPPCPWDKFASSSAVERGHLHILQWLRSQNPPCPWDNKRCLQLAERGNHRDMVTWIRNNTSAH